MEAGKKAAGYQAIDDLSLHEGMVLGIGSGSTIVYAVQRLDERVKELGLANKIICLPTSFQATQLIEQSEGLVLGSLAKYPVIDVAIDGADEVDANLQLIKGGGGCHTQEKIVDANAKRFVVVADATKRSKVLGEKWKKGVPVEVIPSAFVPVKKRLEEELGGKAALRMAVRKAGPCVTDNGNFILDVDFGLIEDPKGIHERIKLMPGVVETGLFVDMASVAYFGNEDGTSEVVSKTKQQLVITASSPHLSYLLILLLISCDEREDTEEVPKAAKYVLVSHYGGVERAHACQSQIEEEREGALASFPIDVADIGGQNLEMGKHLHTQQLLYSGFFG
ncbi:ribose-5-phosphate isomerase rki1 [Balamuthia mandrillaris]